MRKLMQNKKGFTLVELMIVVVIMGILVAVAIPVYGAVTKNAAKKTCDTNIETIKGALNNYRMTGGTDGDEIAWAELETQFEGDNIPAAFKAFFDGSEMPECPLAEDGEVYNIEIDAANKALNVYCGSVTDEDAENHIKAPAAP